MVKMQANGRFSSAVVGSKNPREVFYTTEEHAKVLQQQGVAKILEGPEIKPVPFAYETKPVPASSSRPAQAPKTQTSNDAGDDSASSSSTTATASPRGQTPSTPATPSGGITTTEALTKPSKARGGRRTKGPRKGTA